MSMVGRKQERTLKLFGRYMRIACKRKAKALGIPRYTWQRLSEEAGTNPTIVLKAVSGISKPEIENVRKWIRVLQPDPKLARLILHSLEYTTEAEFQETEDLIDEMEREEDEAE